MGLLKLELAVVDIALIAFSATNGDVAAVRNRFGRIPAANDSRNSKLARNNRRVTGSAAPVSYDCRRALHHRFPVRVRHVGNQHIARLNSIHFAHVANNFGFALADFLANAAARA